MFYSLYYFTENFESFERSWYVYKILLNEQQ